MTHRAYNRCSGRFSCVLLKQGGQRLARANLQEGAGRGTQKLTRSVREPYCLTEMPGPIIGICRLCFCNPCSAHVGYISNPWRTELYGFQNLPEGMESRVHHAGVKRV